MKFTLLVALFVPLQIFAQQFCGTDEMYRMRLAQDPSVATKRQALTDFTANFEAAKTASTTKIIPVVFHVIHNYGPENISRAQVMNALEILNEDFNKLNADTGQVNPLFQSIAANSEIEFRLANIDPFGNCTDGITRTQSILTNNADENVKALISWPNEMYLNIWVVNNISFGAGGYAYYPGTAPLGNEGIVILHTQTGGIGTSYGSNFARRTLTHEVGHYLNLKHTWGDSNNCGEPDNCWDDDDVNDTPNTIGDCQSCMLTQNSCSTGVSNVENYMDYAACTRMFTEGQKVRMHAALNSWIGDRYNLWQPFNLTLTGTNTTTPVVCIPIPDFKSNGTMICEGTDVQFYDYTWGGVVDTYSWSFPGGNPSTSALPNPVVNYSVPGVYPVTLTVTNAAGTDSKTNTDMIIVKPLTATNSIPYSEGFESSVFPVTNWVVQNEGGSQWTRTTNAAYTGSGSAFLNNYNGNITGKTDVMITGSYDLSNIAGTSMKFKLAYAARTPGSNDQLKVYASSNCGQFWTQRYSKTGNQLSTTGFVNNNFVPASPGQWREETVNLSSFLFSGKPNVILKFEYRFDTGNNLYIDDINIDGTLVGLNDDNNIGSELNLYPNPAREYIRIEFTLLHEASVIIELQDVLGRVVYTTAETRLPSGDHYTEIDELATPGIYFVKVKAGENVVTKKLVIQ